MYRLDITIVIPVKNEERNLASCLEAIGHNLAKQIVVIDSGSIDRTVKIAEDFGATVLRFNWNGKFPKKRNWFLRHHTPTTKWVLFLDADEYLTEDFKKELRTTLNEDKAGYWLRYSVHFMGKKLKGGYPLDKLALFQVGAGEYERVDEDQWSRMDMEIHEHPVLSGPVGVMKSKIDHRDFGSVAHYIRKHNEYAAWEAQRFLKAISYESLQQSWTWKQRLKYRLMRSVWIGPAYFMGSFFLLGGFRDGARGLVFAILKMAYFTQVYAKIREARKEPIMTNRGFTETVSVHEQSPSAHHQ